MCSDQGSIGLIAKSYKRDRREMTLTEMARTDDLEWVRDSVAVLVHLIALIYERDTETLVGHHWREAARARAAVSDKAVREAVTGPEDG